MPNKDEKLSPGLFARVRLPLTAKHPMLLVDESAIRTDQSKKYVLMVNEQNQAQYRTVVPGPQIEGKRIIRDGLKPGEKYIANGQGRVFFPGQPVIEDKTTAPAANATALIR